MQIFSCQFYWIRNVLPEAYLFNCYTCSFTVITSTETEKKVLYRGCYQLLSSDIFFVKYIGAYIQLIKWSLAPTLFSFKKAIKSHMLGYRYNQLPRLIE